MRRPNALPIAGSGPKSANGAPVMFARQSQLTGRLRLAHLHEVTEAKGAEMAEQAPRFHKLAREDSAPRVVSSFNLFQTPVELAARLAAMLPPGGRVLEPSAGLGRLYRAARDASRQIVLVEQSADCCAELYREIETDTQAKLVQADFFTCSAERLGGLFDAVLMNPPFKMGADIKHIEHARRMLKPGGRLVALCAAGPRQRKHFADCAKWLDLPSKSFASEGTAVDAAIVIIDNH